LLQIWPVVTISISLAETAGGDGAAAGGAAALSWGKSLQSFVQVGNLTL